MFQEWLEGSSSSGQNYEKKKVINEHKKCTNISAAICMPLF
jgi:hypothetical protein